MKRRTFLAGTAAVSAPAVALYGSAPAVAAPAPGDDASSAAGTVRLVIDGVSHDLPPATLHNTTLAATGTAGQARVTMAGTYSEFSVAFPSPYVPGLGRVSVWLTGVTPKKGNLWLKLFDGDSEEWGTLASRVDPTGFDGRTRVTFEPQRLARMTWSGKGDGRLTHPLRRLVLVFFPDDKQSPDPLVLDVDCVEVVGDGGPVAGWSRAGALELTSGSDRILIDGRGRLLDWTSGGRVQSPGVLPLAVYYDNGTGVFPTRPRPTSPGSPPTRPGSDSPCPGSSPPRWRYGSVPDASSCAPPPSATSGPAPSSGSPVPRRRTGPSPPTAPCSASRRSGAGRRTPGRCSPAASTPTTACRPRPTT
ncbi:hypothetical protein [Streptomyces sp. NPDC004728]|uniref:hypothetical protein n=1 Tax=Streptomyces sp. NPDC004728 TaxID=3154289 RepID=UPI0033A18223